MATKKFKSNVQAEGNLQVDNLLQLPSLTVERALVIDALGQVAEGTATITELGYLSGVTSAIQTQLDAKIDLSEKGAANGVATLDANSKIPSSQIPAVAITDVFVVADIAARDALVVGSADGEVQEGDVVKVTDASADAAINSGAASYIYDGTQYQLLKSSDDVFSVNGQTGVVVLDSDDVAEGVANLYYTDERAQDSVGTILLDTDTVKFTYDDVTPNISANVDITSNAPIADVTDSDELLIYDVSAAALRKVTRSALVGGADASDGDIAETSFALANSVAVPADVTGLAFANATVRSFKAHVSVEIDATANLYEVYELYGVQKDSVWDMSIESTGDNSQVAFTITAAGQVQYTSATYAGFVSGNIKFRAITTTV